MKAAPFRYARASSLVDALTLLQDEDATAIAGGQTLLASLAFRLSAPSCLVDIGRLAELKGISLVGDRLVIGAGTTHAELGRDPLVRQHAPLLAEASALMAHPAIRNRGTIGGSLAYADPAAEQPACIVALDAHLVLVSGAGERRVKASEFFTGLLSTALEPGELIKSVDVPVRTTQDRFAIIEVARRSGDYAMAGVALKLTMDGQRVATARIACFGVGDTPIFAKGAAQALIGKLLDATTIAQAQTALDADLNPPADQHGAPDMKRHLARVVLGRAIRKAMGETA